MSNIELLSDETGIWPPPPPQKKKTKTKTKKQTNKQTYKTKQNAKIKQTKQPSIKSHQHVLREKGRDLTQSCDKNPYTHRTIQNATWQHKNATQNDCGLETGAIFRTGNGLRVLFFGHLSNNFHLCKTISNVTVIKSCNHHYIVSNLCFIIIWFDTFCIRWKSWKIWPKRSWWFKQSNQKILSK